MWKRRATDLPGVVLLEDTGLPAGVGLPADTDLRAGVVLPADTDLLAGVVLREDMDLRGDTDLPGETRPVGMAPLEAAPRWVARLDTVRQAMDPRLVAMAVPPKRTVLPVGSGHPEAP